MMEKKPWVVAKTNQSPFSCLIELMMSLLVLSAGIYGLVWIWMRIFELL